MNRLVRVAMIVSALFLSMPVVAQNKERFPPLSADQLTSAQKQWADDISALPRKANFKSLPYRIYLRSPELAQGLMATSEYFRNTKLPTRITELAILIVAREFDSHFVWRAHYRRAVKSGLDPSVMVDMAAGKRPGGLKQDEATLYDFALEIYRNRSVSDNTYDRALAQFGESGMVDLVALMGYYNTVSMMLITANVGYRKDDLVPPLQAIAR